MEDISQDVIWDESKSNFLKIDTPIGKLKFFVNSVIIFIAQMIVLALLYFVGAKLYINLAYWVMFFAFIFFFYLCLINYSKRLWDILGNRRNAVIVAILLIMLNFIVYYSSILSFVLSFIAFLSLIFLSGKMVKNPE